MEVNLKDVMATTGATVSLIIACTIFMHQIITKYVAMFERLRNLTQELRGKGDEDERSGSLREQVTLYHKRCHISRRALCMLTFSELAFILTVILSGATAAFPKVHVLGIGACVTVVAGLIVLGTAAYYELIENRLTGQAIDSEVSDFPEFARPQDEAASPKRNVPSAPLVKKNT